MSDKQAPAFDLASLMQPLTLGVPGSGAITLDVQSAEFLKWLDQGDKVRRWANPRQFVRDLLHERAVRPSSPAAPDAKHIAALADVGDLNFVRIIPALGCFPAFLPTA